MILSFHPCFGTDIQIILGDQRLDSDILEYIKKADAIILPQACTQNLYQMCVDSTAHLFPDYDARIRYPGKIGQSRMFEDFHLPHPVTLRWRDVDDFKEAHHLLSALPHELPFLIKDDLSHEAEGVFVIEDGNSLQETLERLAVREQSGQRGFVTQAYTPCNGNALRAVVIGKKIITYWKRPDKPGRKITTISRGAIIDHDWRPDLQKKARTQAKALAHKAGINLAAIDFVFPLADKNPAPLFLEINYYFGRRGLGGTENYYRLLYKAIQDWLGKIGMDPQAVTLL